ncbi:MAG TPA: ribokinase [Bacteroidota bacterium]|nr:ribokinase [Bacteroidota bacterium]
MVREGVLVIGSANMDLVVRTEHFPRPGETVFGSGFGMFPGGKGANQAVACARLGSKTHFIGKMGADIFGDTIASGMRRDSILLGHLRVDRSAPTGIATITLDRSGQNEIIVASGGNMKLQAGDIDRARALFRKVRVVLLQLEIPLPTVAHALRLARAAGAVTILNPAPGRKLPKSLLRMVDILTPNETEAAILTGRRLNDASSARHAAHDLLSLGVQSVIVTLGARGCALASGDLWKVFPALRVKPIDTTAAGDAFNGALAHALARGMGLQAAIPLANSVAAYSVTKMGAQTSMPNIAELKHFLR